VEGDCPRHIPANPNTGTTLDWREVSTSRIVAARGHRVFWMKWDQ